MATQVVEEPTHIVSKSFKGRGQEFTRGQEVDAGDWPTQDELEGAGYIRPIKKRVSGIRRATKATRTMEAPPPTKLDLRPQAKGK